MVNTFGQMVGNTKAAGKIVNSMDLELILGLTVADTMATTSTTKNTDMEYTHGRMVKDMMEDGMKTNSTEKLYLQIIRDNQEEGYGKWVKEKCGLIKLFKNDKFKYFAK